MPLDRRVRTALDRAAASVEPDVEGRLASTIDRASRRRDTLPVGLFAMAVLVLALVLLGPRVIGRFGDASPGDRAAGRPPASTPDSAPPNARFEAVAGTWHVGLDAGDASGSDLGLAGAWTMMLRANGVIDLAPPAAFHGSRASGHTFSLDGATFRTDLYYNDYCDAVGTYTWTISNDQLALTPANDACAIRRTVLGSHAWTAGPSGSSTP